jgi:hypothetical protein
VVVEIPFVSFPFSFACILFLFSLFATIHSEPFPITPTFPFSIMFVTNADITFQFKIPVPKDTVVLYFRDGHNRTYWKCELYPRFFHLTITISNTKEDKYTSFLDYTAPLDTVRVLKRNGGQVLQKSVAIIGVGDPQIGTTKQKKEIK